MALETMWETNKRTHSVHSHTHTHTAATNGFMGNVLCAKCIRYTLRPDFFLPTCERKATHWEYLGFGVTVHTHTHIQTGGVYAYCVCTFVLLEFRSSCVLSVWPCDGAHRASAPHRHWQTTADLFTSLDLIACCAPAPALSSCFRTGGRSAGECRRASVKIQSHWAGLARSGVHANCIMLGNVSGMKRTHWCTMRGAGNLFPSRMETLTVRYMCRCAGYEVGLLNLHRSNLISNMTSTYRI